MEEHRRIARWQIATRTEINLPGADVPLNCEIEDINFKGLRMLLPQELAIGTNLALRIALGYGLALNVEATVVWNKPAEAGTMCGLYFTRIKDMDKDNIYQFVQKYFPQQIRQHFYGGMA